MQIVAMKIEKSFLHRHTGMTIGKLTRQQWRKLVNNSYILNIETLYELE